MFGVRYLTLIRGSVIARLAPAAARCRNRGVERLHGIARLRSPGLLQIASTVSPVGWVSAGRSRRRLVSAACENKPRYRDHRRGEQMTFHT
jgi:hypothetical protein